MGKAATQPGWLDDRLAVTAYRLRAAGYGLRLRAHLATSDFVNVLSVIFGTTGIAVALFGAIWFLVRTAHVRQPIATDILGLAVAVALIWGLLRFLGNLSRCMHVAAKTPEAARRIREHMAVGMLNAHAYAKVCQLYEGDVEAANARLKGCAESFEWVTAQDASGQVSGYAAIMMRFRSVTTPDALLGTIVRTQGAQQPLARLAEGRQALMRAWRAEEGTRPIRDEHGDNYVLRQIDCRGQSSSTALALDVGVASYGQIMRTCDALINEFALFSYLAREATTNMRSTTFLSCLPWRRQTHDRAREPGDLFLRPVDRAAGLGVAVITIVLTDPDSPQVSLMMRSREVGTYPLRLHAMPSGMCNTHGTESNRQAVPEWFLRTTMRSEFLEEWYNDPKLIEGRLPIETWRRYVDEEFDRVVGKEIQLTGLAIDLLNLRPELCGTIVVKDWGSELNWEADKHVEYALAEVGNVGPTEIVQSGAAAWVLAHSATLGTAND